MMRISILIMTTRSMKNRFYPPSALLLGAGWGFVNQICSWSGIAICHCDYVRRQGKRSCLGGFGEKEKFLGRLNNGRVTG